jgi:predicted RNA-binding protein associated with RNAse of E/G family
MRLYVYSHIAGQYNSDNRYFQFQLYVDKSISRIIQDNTWTMHKLYVDIFPVIFIYN